MSIEDTYVSTTLSLQPIDLSTYTEVTIHAPANVVWGYMTDGRQAKFSPATYRLESGNWGQVESVFQSYSTIGGTERPFPKFRYKIIASIPNKHYVWRVSMQMSADAIETFVGYDISVLEEINGSTKVTFIQPVTFGNLNADPVAFKEGQEKYIGPIFEQLKRLVESEYRH